MKAPGTVVIADDTRASLDLLTTILTRDGYTVHAARDGEEALQLALQQSPDIIVTDVLMPKLSGFELCRWIKGNRATRFIPVVLVTGLDGARERIEGINAGADDFLHKPVNAQELQARVRSLVRLKRFTDDLDSAESVILSLALTVEARDPCTGGHCVRMSSYASLFGTHLGLPDDDVTALARGGYLHDVGKIGVPDAVLLKAGPLTPSEFAIIKQHTVTGDQLCGDLRPLRLVKPIVRSHHERIDGSGYPDGLAGDAVPLLAQITGIVDVYDALTTDRPYRSALTSAVSLAELDAESRRGLHQPDLVCAFAELHRSGRFTQPTRRGTDLQGHVVTDPLRHAI
ncbi:MAG: response regulator [Vicinamibacteria bacterium]|nr:response regulator [Vicinamibacteria bacterium]